MSSGTFALSLADALAHRRATQVVSAADYYDDPVGFIRDCIKWPDDRRLTPYQEEILRELPVRKRVAVRGPHGLGKLPA